MKPYLIHIFAVTVSGVLLAAGLLGCNPAPEQDRINISKILSSTTGTACYEKADAPLAIDFPRDSGPHNTFRTEWWYYTGNLETSRGRQFGYQLTFFRQALSCEPVKGASKWRTRQLYFAHFAVTDIREKAFFSDFRMNRQSLGIAGAKSVPYTVWIDDWQAGQADNHLVLTAKGKKAAIKLFLNREKPVILQGNQGLSRKGREPFNASYYYSLPRLEANGTIEIGPDIYRVTGKSWFDHEWSTSALGADVAGWDWFSVHLNDGRDLMVCRIRKADGTPSKYGFGSISFSDGTYVILSAGGFSIKTKKYWKSPATGRQYPSGWEIFLPGYSLVLTAVPMVQNQEHTHMFAYWEGAVHFSGKGITGLGYAELTGY